MYGPELCEAFERFKGIWDPGNRMNPHKVVDPYPIVSNMKLGSDYSPPEVETHFSYPSDGGSFAHAALRCVGAGKCRDDSTGTMCPSFVATRDEKHTTRGRARALYEMLQGDTITDGFRSDEVNDALDLCLSCKGCKSDCPVSVDMATYKAEFLSKYHKGRLRPLPAYSMGLIMVWARLAQHVPRLANLITSTPGVSALIKRAGGLTSEREMPPFAEQTFKAWFADRGQANPEGEPVLLFPDTFNNYLHPEPLKATVEVLEAAGFRVEVPQAALCCGRPLYDYGMLDTAKLFWRRMLDELRPQIQAGTPMVGVEPSCVASFRDELPNLFPHDEDAKRLSLQTLTLGEFLQEHASDWEPPRLERKALVHVHCHQEATAGSSAEEQLYERMGLDYEVLDSGCCGLAGSFGFEADHHDVSVEIFKQRLLPLIRKASPEAILIGDGFSCKTQVEQLTERRPLHTAQVLKMAMEQGPQGPAARARSGATRRRAHHPQPQAADRPRRRRAGRRRRGARLEALVSALTLPFRTLPVFRAFRTFRTVVLRSVSAFRLLRTLRPRRSSDFRPSAPALPASAEWRAGMLLGLLTSSYSTLLVSLGSRRIGRDAPSDWMELGSFWLRDRAISEPPGRLAVATGILAVHQPADVIWATLYARAAGRAGRGRQLLTALIWAPWSIVTAWIEYALILRLVQPLIRMQVPFWTAASVHLISGAAYPLLPLVRSRLSGEPEPGARTAKAASAVLAAPALLLAAIAVAGRLGREPRMPGLSERARRYDASFLRSMHEHHCAGLELARLAADRAPAGELRTLGRLMAADHAAELAAMEAWWRSWQGGEMPKPGQSEELAMRGMPTAEELEELARLEGEGFQQRFLELMIPHHLGGIAMCDDLWRSPGDPRVLLFADGIRHAQVGQAERMEAWLAPATREAVRTRMADESIPGQHADRPRSPAALLGGWRS